MLSKHPTANPHPAPPPVPAPTWTPTCTCTCPYLQVVNKATNKVSLFTRNKPMLYYDSVEVKRDEKNNW